MKRREARRELMQPNQIHAQAEAKEQVHEVVPTLRHVIAPGHRNQIALGTRIAVGRTVRAQ